MTEEELYELALSTAGDLGGEVYDFAPGWEAARIHGKWFMLTTVHEHRQVIVKAHPEDSVTLRNAFPFITPGYHMNKRHWISIHPDPRLEPQLVHDLIEDSFLAVRG